MTQYLNPWSGRQFIDANGNPYSGAKLFTYAAGTSTKVTTTKDQAGASNHANPIILNTKGEPAETGGSSAAYPIWQTGGQAIKLVLAPANDTDPPASPIASWDNISGINDSSVTLDQWISGTTPTFISTTSFSVAGDQTTNFHIGRRIKAVDSGGTDYGTITNSVYTTLTTVTVVLDSGVLDSGLSSVSYGILSKTNNSLPAPLGVLINTMNLCQGRLTLTTATPITTSDVTAATTIYFTPYKGSHISLYDGSTYWNTFSFSELSLSVPATTNQMYDIFAYNNSGVVAIEALAWTNDTTRATAITLQNGVLVKTGATTRRYIGSFRTTGVSGQTEDSLAKRYVWNYYNRALRYMQVLEATDSWVYSLATFRQARATATNQLDCVIGYSEDIVTAGVDVTASNDTNGTIFTVVGVGIDSTTVNSAQIFPRSERFVSDGGAIGLSPVMARYKGYPGVGRHTLVWLEYSEASGNTTWYGDNGSPTTNQSGISGEIWA